MSDREVTLNWYEILVAAFIGVLRNVSAIKHNRQNLYGAKSDWQIHIEGACGEMALAKHLNVYWAGTIDTFSGSDVGELQVRTRSEHSWDLIVREKDNPNDIFVLLTGACPNYRVHGWIRGRDARRDEWIKTYGNREPAWFVPQIALRPVNELWSSA